MRTFQAAVPLCLLASTISALPVKCQGATFLSLLGPGAVCSSDFKFSKDSLTATCASLQGGFNVSTIKLSQCIENENGQMIFCASKHNYT